MSGAVQSSLKLSMPSFRYASPIDIDDLQVLKLQSKLYVLHLKDLKELESFLYMEAFYEYSYETHFLIFIEDEGFDAERAFQLNILQNSHFSTLLIAFKKDKLLGYRSTLLPDKELDMFHIFDGNVNEIVLFNEKLLTFQSRPMMASTTEYAPFVLINELEDGTKSYEGFEVDIFRLMAAELGSRTVIISPENVFDFFFLSANLTGM